MVVRPRLLSLCAGIGGLDLGLRMACGARTVGYVERDAYAAAVLVARMEDEALDPAPIWNDLATFPGHRYRGKVDLVLGGIPCQPHSAAGSRRGMADERNLWPHFWRIVQECGAPAFFLENVRGFVRSGLPHVLEDLAYRGWDAEWTCVRASEVGAPHRRERIFLLAYADGGRREGVGVEMHAAIEGAPGNLAHGCGDGRAAWPLGDADGAELEGSPAADGLLRFPPAPGDAAGWRAYLAAGGPEPAIRRGPDGVRVRSRVDRLRCLGNAVVPQQAALAFCVLARRAGLEVMR